MLLYPFNWLLSFKASLLRLGAGAGAPAQTLKQPIIIYEFEGCPFCRIAREAISATGVRVLIKPCPKGGKRFRPKVAEQGGKTQFPYMIDPNTDTGIYESSDIAAYLRKTYAGGQPRPLIQWLGPVNNLTSSFAVVLRLMGGNFVKPSSTPAKPLEFYGAERSPASRIVKELLCEMELEYYWRSQALGQTKTPLLIDPNTGEEATGALAIRKYLKRTYGV